MKDAVIYATADKEIKDANREIVRDFGRLKTARFDEVHVIRMVTALYREQARKLRRRYYEVGFEAYLLGLYLCGITGVKAHSMAEKAITIGWVDERLKEVNPTTLFRFDTETERKAQRLIEALTGAAETDGSASGGGGKPHAGTDGEIDRAMKAWSKQAAQYALSITDDALLAAYGDAGEDVMWLSERDARVCTECHQLDGKVFRVDEVPKKPHWLCRCRLVPAKGRAEAKDGRRATEGDG